MHLILYWLACKIPYCNIYVKYKTCVIWYILHCYVIADLQSATRRQIVKTVFLFQRKPCQCFSITVTISFTNYYCVFSHDFHHKRFNLINKGGFLKTEDTAICVRTEGEEQLCKTGTEKHVDLCHRRKTLLSSEAAASLFRTEPYATLANISITNESQHFGDESAGRQFDHLLKV